MISMTRASPLAAASKTTGTNIAISILSAVCAQRTSSSRLFKERACRTFAVNCTSPRCKSYSRRMRRSACTERKYPPPASPRICPHPPAFSILSPRRPVTEEPLPAFTTIPSPCPSAAATPESRSLPVMIFFAPGQIFAQRFASDCRSSAVPHPARKMPARSTCFGSSEKIACKRSGVSRRKFDDGSFP